MFCSKRPVLPPNSPSSRETHSIDRGPRSPNSSVCAQQSSSAVLNFSCRIFVGPMVTAMTNRLITSSCPWLADRFTTNTSAQKFLLFFFFWSFLVYRVRILGEREREKEDYTLCASVPSRRRIRFFSPKTPEKEQRNIQKLTSSHCDEENDRVSGSHRKHWRFYACGRHIQAVLNDGINYWEELKGEL